MYGFEGEQRGLVLNHVFYREEGGLLSSGPAEVYGWILRKTREKGGTVMKLGGNKAVDENGCEGGAETKVKTC